MLSLTICYSMVYILNRITSIVLIENRNVQTYDIYE